VVGVVPTNMLIGLVAGNRFVSCGLVPVGWPVVAAGSEDGVVVVPVRPVPLVPVPNVPVAGAVNPVTGALGRPTLGEVT
jgi:hypothetical protein